MIWRRVIVVGTLLAAVLSISGCRRKKPPLPPPQANAPILHSPPPALPTEINPEPPATPSQPQPAPEKPAAGVPAKRRPHAAARKERPKPTAPKTSERPHTVIPEGGAQPSTGGQLSIPADSTAQQRLNTTQLLDAADRNLNSIRRTLSPDEQLTVEHIRSYMAQSRQATHDGDFERAYQLALKAHLMSDAIAKK